MLPFFAFIHLHCASHLGTLDEPREGWKDVMLEPNPKMVFGGSILKMKGLIKCKDRRCSPNECHLTNTDLVLDPRQAPKHSKPSMFLQISFESFMFDVLDYKSWLETLDA